MSKPHVLILRAGDGKSDDLVRLLGDFGFSSTVERVLRVGHPDSFRHVDEALRRLNSFEWLLLTSANSVRSVAARLTALNIDLRTDHSPNIAVVGPATAQAVLDTGWELTLQSEESSAEGLLQVMVGQQRGNVLLPQSNLADTFLEHGLHEAGFGVTKIVAYTVNQDEEAVTRASDAVLSGEIEALVLYSPSTAEIIAPAVTWAMSEIRVTCIGNRTAKACRAYGIAVASVADDPTDEAVAAAVRSASNNWL